MASAGPLFRSLSDAELLELLYTSGDRLPRDAVEEVLRRGTQLLPALAEIVQDKASWTQPLPEWWAVVHATYALGAMERHECLVPLLTALRWADAFDCDWVTEDLPSIFGRLGPAAFDPLRAAAHDVTAGPGARSVALAGMAAIAVSAPHLSDEVIAYSAELLAGEEEPVFLRQTAANVLLDFRCRRHRKLLVAFGREEARRKREDPEYQGVFYDWEVDELLGEPQEASLEYYRRDWLAFYDPEEMDRRQERWEREKEEARQEEGEAGRAPGRQDTQAPCSCGSGRPYAECCFLKVH